MSVNAAAGPLQRALALAESALSRSNPNPRVGCVITAPDGQVLGEGSTQARGQAHAEVMALRDAAARGHVVAGATAWVTLEPCSHHGRTPPCCDALVQAGIAQVVVASLDPNPRVAGQGVARLRAAGLGVTLLAEDDPLCQQARSLNIGFFSRMLRGRPWVRMKIAASLDGVSALPNGESQWITGPAARLDGHAWRARACAVLTGIGTVLEDDPMLDVRAPGITRQPHLVVVDSRLETPDEARLWGSAAHDLPRQVWIAHARHPEEAASAARIAALQARGAQVLAQPGAHGKVDLGALLHTLAEREVNELHLEAGHKLNGSFLREGLVDELLVYLAPRLLGQGAGMSNWGPLERIGDGLPLAFVDHRVLGDDLRLVARVQGRDSFLARLPIAA